VPRMRPVDLRSDTVTRPTPEMRRAMAEAEVGDDVWGDDPTVIALEAETARVLGKQAAVYVPSGTMGNQAAVRAHTRRGDEILVHRLAHVVVHEQGGVSALSGVQPLLLGGDRGTLDVETLEAAWHDASDVHYARQALVCVENTVGEAGGLVVAPARVRDIAAFARAHGMRVHMDGARAWNAAVALDLPPAAVVADVDTVSVCFSKGLGAPVGSAVAGDAEVIQEVRRNRKLFGGGMRQAGIIAAGALHALHHHVERLADDHRNARRLAEGLAGARRVAVDPAAVETNIVLVAVPDGSAEALVDELAGVGVLAGRLNTHTVRFVTHLDAQEAAVDAALEAMTPLLR
jgi:threonine aldolase